MASSRGGSTGTGASRMHCSSRLSAALRLSVVAFAVAASATLLAQGPIYRMGPTPSAEETKARDTVAFPQGRALPVGSRGGKDGAGGYAKKCAAGRAPNGTR